MLAINPITYPGNRKQTTPTIATYRMTLFSFSDISVNGSIFLMSVFPEYIPQTTLAIKKTRSKFPVILETVSLKYATTPTIITSERKKDNNMYHNLCPILRCSKMVTNAIIEIIVK